MTRHTGVEHAPVFRGCFPPARQKIPWQYVSIPGVIFLVLTKNSSLKTAKHLSAVDIGGISAAEDAALLAQGKDEQAKSTQ
ncbi:MAG: hypothetical protein Q4F17_08400 [Eubacteriales bacterium]|nr:hypothetical protein [Eubacteriales bacterium]